MAPQRSWLQEAVDAAERGDAKALQQLEDLRSKPWEQQLSICAFAGQTAWVQRLLDAQPEGDCSPAVSAALQKACSKRGNAATVRLLAAHVPDASKLLLACCLSLAARYGTADMVQVLLDLAPGAAEQAQVEQWHRLDAGMRLDERDYVVRGDVLPLHLAARRRRGPSGALQMLLRAAANAVYAADGAGQLPLHWAARCGFLEGVQLLLQAGPAAVEVPDELGRLPLHLAAHQANLAVVQALLQARPSAAAAADSSGRLPLHYAACSGSRPELVQLLLAAAPACGPDDSGRWPLHYAASRGNATPAVVVLLLAVAPAAAAQPDGEGRLPLELALAEAADCWSDAHDNSFDIPPQSRRARAANAAQHVEAARLLLPSGGAAALEVALAALARAERALAQAGPVAEPLWADVAARWRLTAQQWQQVPSPCPGLAAALPAVLRRSEVEAACLVRHLPDADCARLRTFACSLARAAREVDPPLPAPAVRLALSMFGVP